MFELKNGLLKKIYTEEISVDLTDDIYIVTDKNRYFLSKLDFNGCGDKFLYKNSEISCTLCYETPHNSSFIKRKLRVSFGTKTAVLKIGAVIPAAKQAFLYKTFYNASAAVFLRTNGIGMFTGFENPYFELTENGVEFEPSLILEKNEPFECDINFYGIYRLSGKKIQPQLPASQITRNGRCHPRYRNPSEGTELYFSEIYMFNQYTSEYFEVKNKSFKFMSYDFFGNLPQRPATEEEKNAYIRHIDAFCEIGGDTVILNPMCENVIPDSSTESYWALFPQNSAAWEIFCHAKAKGLKVGIYMGTAGTGQHGNSSLINYCDNKAWKKIDVNGNLSTENCIGDDGFASWFIQVQKNTIKKYGLSVWNWDPGPGNAMFCFNERHGHLAGKGAYKGFRNSLAVMKSLKDEFHGLYIQGFHGSKEYGLWGFKYIDQHEAYWENDVYFLNPLFCDLSPDRHTADGIRFQSTWNYYFRFMPPALNHGLAHRMIQDCGFKMINLDLLFDYCGWKFALLSAIAAGGSVTLPILPRNPGKIDGYTEFYKKWIAWAKENFEYSRNTIPFGAQPGCGVYLHYPKAEDEMLPETGRFAEYKFYNAPVLDEKIKVTYARVNSDNVIYPNTENTVDAAVNDFL